MRELDHLQTEFTVTEDNIIDDENEKVNAGQIDQEVKQEQTTKPFKYDHCDFESKSLKEDDDDDDNDDDEDDEQGDSNLIV